MLRILVGVVVLSCGLPGQPFTRQAGTITHIDTGTAVGDTNGTGAALFSDGTMYGMCCGDGHFSPACPIENGGTVYHHMIWAQFVGGTIAAVNCMEDYNSAGNFLGLGNRTSSADQGGGVFVLPIGGADHVFQFLQAQEASSQFNADYSWMLVSTDKGRTWKNRGTVLASGTGSPTGDIPTIANAATAVEWNTAGCTRCNGMQKLAVIQTPTGPVIGGCVYALGGVSTGTGSDNTHQTQYAFRNCTLDSDAHVTDPANWAGWNGTGYVAGLFQPSSGLADIMPANWSAGEIYGRGTYFDPKFSLYIEFGSGLQGVGEMAYASTPSGPWTDLPAMSPQPSDASCTGFVVPLIGTYQATSTGSSITAICDNGSIGAGAIVLQQFILTALAPSPPPGPPSPPLRNPAITDNGTNVIGIAGAANFTIANTPPSNQVTLSAGNHNGSFGQPWTATLDCGEDLPFEIGSNGNLLFVTLHFPLCVMTWEMHAVLNSGVRLDGSGTFHSPQQGAVWLAFSGDSITAGAGTSTSYPADVLSAMPTVSGQNFGLSGAVACLSGCPGTTPIPAPIVNGQYRTNIDLFLGGTNDIANGRTAAQIYSDLQSRWASMKTAGFKVIAFTIPDAVGRDETVRSSLNALIRGTMTLYDSLVDLGADPVMGCSGCDSNAIYFSDGVHPTDAGNAYIASLVVPVVRSLLAPVLGTLQPDGSCASWSPAFVPSFTSPVQPGPEAVLNAVAPTGNCIIPGAVAVPDPPPPSPPVFPAGAGICGSGTCK